MIKKNLGEKTILQQVDLFDPSRSYMNYLLTSKSGETSISFNCVERHSDVCLGDTFSDIILFSEEPENTPPIMSMGVKLVSAGTSQDGSENFYRFEGVSRPYSEVSIMTRHFSLDDVGKLMGKSFFIGLE